MNITYKFSKESNNIVNEELNNGDIIFNQEDKSINLKMNDELIKFSQEDAWVDVVDKSLIGIALTGEFDSNGAKLAWINKNFNEITDNLDADYFNSNPVFNFETVEDNGNTMVKVPLCYWWKGIIPTGKYQGKWGMLVSTKAATINGEVMKPNYVAFMNTNGELQNSFAIGAYRGKLSGSKFVSTAGGNPTGGYTFEQTKNYCTANSGAYSLLTFQAWHDICSRAVIERKSFMLTGTDAARNTLNDITGYRGIVDAFYTYNNTVYAEWMDGVRSKQVTASTNRRVIQTFSNDGSRTYVDAYTTAENMNYSGYPTEFLSNEYMDNLLFGKPETFSKTEPAAGVNDISPDYQYITGSSESPRLSCMALYSINPSRGPLYCDMDYSPTYNSSAFGGRLAAFL